MQNQQFQNLPRAIDTAFFKDALSKGVEIFSGEPEDYVHIRYSKLSEHTWKADSKDFLRPATPIASGLHLELAWSSARTPGIAELPKHSGGEATDKGHRSPPEEVSQGSDTKANVE